MAAFRFSALVLLGLAALAASNPAASSRPAASSVPMAPAHALTAASAGWVNLEWAYRIQLTAAPDSIEGTGDLAEFPVLITLGPAQSHVFQGARADGMDLIVTAGDGTTVLPHEVVRFDPLGQEAELWFQANPLSKTSNTFYLYYGNPAHDTGPAQGTVWNSKYVAVYHFSENPALGQLKDWSPRASHGVCQSNAYWTDSDITAGQIGQAWLFNGTTHYINGNSISTPDSSFVISAWLKAPSNTTDFVFQANPQYWHVSAQINEVHRFPHYNAANPWRDLRWGPNPLPNDDLYHQYTWVFDGEADTILFYFDGTQQPAVPWSLEAGTEHFYTGHPINPDHLTLSGCGVMGPMHWNSLDLLTGPGDEFRLSERTQTSAWIRTEYRNQRTPQGFFTYGPEEPGGTVPVRLLSLEAAREGPRAVVRWAVAGSGEDLAGFHVHRENAAGARERLTDAMLQGRESYAFADEAPPPGTTLYWIAEHTRAGDVIWHGPATLGAEVSTLPVGLRLAAAPNPFRAGTTVSFRLDAEADVSLVVYDLGGREVTGLVSERLGAGEHRVEWNGRTSSSARAMAGIYLARLQAGSQATSGKLVLLP